MRWIIGAALVLGIGMSGATPAAAYCLKRFTGTVPYASWETAPVSYRVSSDLQDPALLAAIDSAFGTWGGVECSKLKFTKGANFDRKQTPFEHNEEAILIFWYGDSAGFPTETQYASYSFVGHNNAGRLTRGAIAINDFGYDWSASGEANKIDLQSELTAYIGSVIGLTFSNSPNSIMRNNISFGDTSKRSLLQDDRDALRYLYGDDSCASMPEPGIDGCSGGAAPLDGGSAAADGGSTRPDAGGQGKSDLGSLGLVDAGPRTDGGGSRQDTGTSPAGCTRSTDCASGQVCTAEGSCVALGSSCSRSDQCPTGQSCTVEGRCVKPDSGGCSASPSLPEGPWFVLTMALLLSGIWLGLRRHRV